jgi:hypothetical protein
MWDTFFPKTMPLPSDPIALLLSEKVHALFDESDAPPRGNMEEADEGSERFLELWCSSRSPGSDCAPLPGSNWRTENVVAGSGGRGDGLCTEICDSVAEPCARKRYADCASTSADLWLGGAKGAYVGALDIWYSRSDKEFTSRSNGEECPTSYQRDDSYALSLYRFARLSPFEERLSSFGK